MPTTTPGETTIPSAIPTSRASGRERDYLLRRYDRIWTIIK